MHSQFLVTELKIEQFNKNVLSINNIPWIRLELLSVAVSFVLSLLLSIKQPDKPKTIHLEHENYKLSFYNPVNNT